MPPPTDHPRAGRRDGAVLFALALWSTAVPALGAAVALATAGEWLPLVPTDPARQAVALLLASACLTGLSLIPSHVAALACGYVAGGVHGPVVAVAGISSGAVFGYLLAVLLLGERVERLVRRSPRAEALHSGFLGQRRGQRVLLVTLLRLSPVMPFAATNFLLVAARVQFVAFLLGSVAGLLPRVLAVAWAGAGLARLQAELRLHPWLVALGAAATLALVWLVGRIVRRALRHSLPHATAEPRR